MADIPTLEPFDVYNDPHSLHSRWNNYKERFCVYVIALGITNAAQKRALFLHVAGKGIFDTASNNLGNPGTTIDELFQALDNSFLGQKNICFERYEFRNLCQRENTIEQWYGQLPEKAKHCNFENMTKEQAISDQVVAGCRNPTLRRRLLRESDISLQEALKLTKSMEASEEYATAKEIPAQTSTENTTGPANLSGRYPDTNQVLHVGQGKQKRQKEPPCVSDARKRFPPNIYELSETGTRVL